MPTCNRCGKRLRVARCESAGPVLLHPCTCTQRLRVLAVVKEGPATTADVQAETGLPRRHSCAYLRALWQAGLLVRRPFRQAGRRLAYLYDLAARAD